MENLDCVGDDKWVNYDLLRYKLLHEYSTRSIADLVNQER